MLAARSGPTPRPATRRITLPGAEGGYGRGGRRPRGLRPHVPAGRLPHRRRARRRPARARRLVRRRASPPAPTRRRSPERWVRLDEHPQAKVEAASLALILDLTRPWIWDRLSPRVQEQVVDYLAPAVGDTTYPRINWVWFRLVVQTFLRSVGGPLVSAEMAEDLATHDTLRRAPTAGWPTARTARTTTTSAGRCTSTRRCGRGWPARPTSPPPRAARDVADARPVPHGRRAAGRRRRVAAAAGPQPHLPVRGRRAVLGRRARRGARRTPPGRCARGAVRIVRHFADRGAPDDDGLLTLGWHGAWPRLAPVVLRARLAVLGEQGPARPRAAGRPSGVDGRDGAAAGAEPATRARRRARPAGSSPGTTADGIVRVVNHGTDHAVEGATSPTRRSTPGSATRPRPVPLARRAGVDRADRPVGRAGRRRRRRTHRAGMRTLAVRVDEPATVVGSARRRPRPLGRRGPQQAHHGSGCTGRGARRPAASPSTRWCAGRGRCGSSRWTSSPPTPAASRRRLAPGRRRPAGSRNRPARRRRSRRRPHLVGRRAARRADRGAGDPPGRRPARRGHRRCPGWRSTPVPARWPSCSR